MDKQCCGKCKYHKPETPGYRFETEWLCDNEESDSYSCYTEYDDGTECVDFEEREGRR